MKQSVECLVVSEWGTRVGRVCSHDLELRAPLPPASLSPTQPHPTTTALQALHKVGIIHRDIKPANIVFDERRRRFRLIDLGAAACLRTGTNYKPAETILDPCYCPPEEVSLLWRLLGGVGSLVRRPYCSSVSSSSAWWAGCKSWR